MMANANESLAIFIDVLFLDLMALLTHRQRQKFLLCRKLEGLPSGGGWWECIRIASYWEGKYAKNFTYGMIQVVPKSNWASLLWFNSYRGEKEETQEVQRDERGEGGVEGSAGDTQAGAAGGEHEEAQKRQAQTQPGKATGRCGPQLVDQGEQRGMGRWLARRPLW
jgi:hypothetical protein